MPIGVREHIFLHKLLDQGVWGMGGGLWVKVWGGHGWGSGDADTGAEGWG